MNIEYRNGLLFVSLVVSHEGISETIHDLVLDTGAAQSIIDMDAIQLLDVSSKNEDEFVFMSGIGGRESALRKRMDHIQFDSYHMLNAHLDFAYLDEHPGINGLLGSDILLSGGFVIDLKELEIYQKPIT
ncbi:retropepsin-like aspartic protease [Alicyclobacillus sp. SO9]|uniref:retropepsin-like aspartic protease n=1 Tax=Alicyclobacillus sp. SO9 TaxID=2665646 RepID=UPI0018E79B1F|nr:retropepsin-like aspartic protease [Alicyclobacillus sp. SO9]QQE78901.1 retropepsin-like domain-containing protein [Alicyclobacillus sp. SO9]